MKKNLRVFLRVRKKPLKKCYLASCEIKRYQGKYVAVVDGDLVDFDSDKAAMVMRVVRKYGYRPIYADRVSEEKEYVEFSSPE